jgi:hypothetical protein
LSTPRSALTLTLDGLLSPAEVEALSYRISGLLDTGCFPQPNGRGPAVPWPPL